MCGLFAFSGHMAKWDALQHVAILAATRGPHSHGYVWISPEAYDDTNFCSHRAMGPLTLSMTHLSSVNAGTIIGHSRLATTGTYAGGEPKLDDTMPFRSGPVAIVHNGNVPEYQETADELGVKLKTGCDSELIAILLDRTRHLGLQLSLQAVMNRLYGDNDRPFVVIAMNSDRKLTAIRRGLPLFQMVRDEGMYLCSRPPEHPSTTEWPEAVALEAGRGIISV